MIYIILPIHNRKNITKLFIKSLIIQTYKEFRLILIDDGSTDGTDEMVLSYLPESIILKGNGNLWWAGALQKSYKWLSAYASANDVCLIINDDTVFDGNFLKTGKNILMESTKTLLLAQCYSQQTGELIDHGVHVDFKKLSFRQAKTKEQVNCLSTRGLFLTVEDFKTIGGFYPRVLPHYLSDYEFTIRAFKKNYSLITDENLRLYVNQETTGLHTIKANGLLDYYSKYFSNRNSSNPFHWLAFVYLVVPQPFKLYHILRIFYSMIKSLFKPLFPSFPLSREKEKKGTGAFLCVKKKDNKVK